MATDRNASGGGGAAARPLGPRARMFTLMVVRALTKRGSRLTVALGAIAVGAAVVFALTSLYFDISIKMSEELRTFGPNIIISPHVDEKQGGESRLADASLLESAAKSLPADRMVGATPYLYGVVRLDRGNAVLVGADMAAMRALAPYWQVDGGWIAASFDDRNAMVGRRLATSMGLKVGDPVTIVNRDRSTQASVTIKGIMDTGEAEDDQIFINLALAQKILNEPGKANFAMASIVADGAEADSLAASIGQRFPGIEARPIRKVSEADGQILGKIDGLMALVALIILVITTLCVNATLTAMVAERTPQIGLQKAIGASDGSIVAQFLAETALVCLVAVAIGIVGGFLLAQLLGQAVFSAWVTFRPGMVPLTLGLCLIAALAAAMLPIRGAVRVVPARVLRGE
ncbi:ABC transporter permease [Consotaella salsifontis]|uniref:Putative ABC transport system permease protein n=1 Tax=Consotaella salsifontis TaxID=1365950 RepID=A0A1T4MTT6_9HYPH|nr:ABC transporter permease [Consotaella salsifontis]SJZ70479.1 putative ABC transport system permease protein [Consotaella salsifontis]